MSGCGQLLTLVYKGSWDILTPNAETGRRNTVQKWGGGTTPCQLPGPSPTKRNWDHPHTSEVARLCGHWGMTSWGWNLGDLRRPSQSPAWGRNYAGRVVEVMSPGCPAGEDVGRNKWEPTPGQGLRAGLADSHGQLQDQPEHWSRGGRPGSQETEHLSTV